MKKGVLKKVISMAMIGAMLATTMVGLSGCGGESKSSDSSSNELAFWAYEF